MQAAMDQAEFFAFCKGTASVIGFPGLGHVESRSGKTAILFCKDGHSLRALNLARLLRACRRTESPVFCDCQESADDSRKWCESLGAKNGKDGVSAL